MKLDSHTFKTVAITALISCIITGIAKDIIYFCSGGVIMNKVSQVSDIIRKNYLFDYDEDEMAEYAASALALSVGDDYTVYYPKEDFNEYKDMLSNSFVGVGIELGVDTEQDKLMVIAPIENSPAANAGILANDYIIKVDDVGFNGGELHEAVSAIRGEENTSVKLTVERDGKTMDFTIIRQIIKNSSVVYKMLDDGICYIRITEFSSSGEYDKNSAYEDFMKGIEFFKENNAEKLILDLRNNPGGSLEVVIKIADELLPEGLITYTETKDGKRREFYSKDGELDVPVVILVNSSSASASNRPKH